LQVAPEYKGNRKKSPMLYFDTIKQYLINEMGFVVVSGIENDDAMSISARILGYENSIIASHDKDMGQVPCEHYVLKKNMRHTSTEFGEMIYNPEKTKIFANGKSLIYAQMLMGDTADNIQGIAGIGPSGAYHLLKGCNEDEMIGVVQKAYYQAFGNQWRQKYLVNLQLLVLRTQTKDFVLPEVSEFEITNELTLTPLRPTNDEDDVDISLYI
jgi:DNA polymerase-1